MNTADNIIYSPSCMQRTKNTNKCFLHAVDGPLDSHSRIISATATASGRPSKEASKA